MSESGHPINIAHFEQMISFILSWGAPYNPTNAAITLANLTAKLTAAKAAVDAVVVSAANLTTTINDRETEFSGIRPLVTRCFQYYESTGAAQNQIDDVRTLKRKLDGARASTKATPPPGGGNPTGPGSGSASQQSYTQIVEHFDGIIQLFLADGGYNPHEAELKTTALQTQLATMQGANTNVINATTTVSNHRATRDTDLYADGSGLVDLAFTAKKYVRAAFGQDSSQAQQIAGLTFSRPRTH